VFVAHSNKEVTYLYLHTYLLADDDVSFYD